MSDPIHEDGDEGQEVRARVNGRRLVVEADTCKVIKGPPALVGKYIARQQVREIADTSFHGHLFVVDHSDDIRLADDSHQLARLKEATEMIGAKVSLNGSSGWEVTGLSDKMEYEITRGTNTKTLTMELFEQCCIIEEPPLPPEVDGDFGSFDVELPQKVMESIVMRYIDDNMDTLAEKIAEKLMSTNPSLREHLDQDSLSEAQSHDERNSGNQA